MKKIILFSFLFLNFYNALYCQSPSPLTFKLNKANGTFEMVTIPEFVKFGEKYIVKIENINLNVYDVKESNSQIAYNIERPAALSFVIPGYYSPLSAQNQSNKDISQTYSAGGNLNSVQMNYNAPKILLDTFEHFALKVVELDWQLEMIRSDCGGSYSEAKGIIDTFFLKSFNSLTSLGEFESWSDSLFKKIDKLEVHEDPNNVKKKISAQVAKRNKRISDAKRTVNEFRKNHKVQNVLKNYKLINPSNYTYISKPIAINSDLLKLNFDVTSKNLTDCNFPTNMTISENIPVRGGCKVDFSTGFNIMFGSEDYIGRSLFFEQSNSDSSKMVVSQNDSRGKLLTGIGAMVHFSKRTYKNVNLLGTLGVSTSSDFSNVNIHLGPSVSFGKGARIIISAGLTARESFIPDSRYEIGSSHLKEGIPESVPSIKVFPIFGGFLGLSYNWIDPSKR